MRGGQRVGAPPSLQQICAHAADQLARLPEPPRCPVEVAADPGARTREELLGRAKSHTAIAAAENPLPLLLMWIKENPAGASTINPILLGRGP